MLRIVKGFLVVGAVLLGGCGKETTNVTNVTSCKPSIWNTAAPAAPPCTVALNFRVTDTNAVFTDGQLEWKGSMQYDPITRIAYKDGNWAGPYPRMYDDGAWDDTALATPGHEPSGETKGDHIFGVTIFVFASAAGETFEYGLNDSTYANGWIWPNPSNGTVVVPAGASGEIDAQSVALPAFGAVNLKLTLDTNSLDAGFTLPTAITAVQVKGSGWAWTDVTMKDDGLVGDAAAGDGIYTFILSNYIGAGNLLPHTGLFASGAKPEFVFDFVRATDPLYTEYKVGGAAATAGVTAATGVTGTAGPWTTATIQMQTNNNTYVTIP